MPAFTVRGSTLRGGDVLRGLPAVVAPKRVSGISAFTGPFEIIFRQVSAQVRGELRLVGRVEAVVIREGVVRAPLVLRGETRGRVWLSAAVEGALSIHAEVRGERIWHSASAYEERRRELAPASTLEAYRREVEECALLGLTIE